MGRIAALLRRPGRPMLAHARDVGRRTAGDEAPVGEALRELRTDVLAGQGREPRPEEVEALVEGWAETALGYLHRLSCEDPMTGLATMAHLRTRVGELRRAGADLAADHALVVVTPAGPARGPSGGTDPVGTALGTAVLGERVRVVFGGETVARAAGGRVVVLAQRDHRLDRLVPLLERLLAEAGRCGRGTPAAVRVEELPADELAVVLLLERLDTA